MVKKILTYTGLSALLLSVLALIFVFICFIYYLNAKDYRTAFSQILARQNGNQDTSGSRETGKKQDRMLNIAFLGIDRTEERDQWLGVYRTDTIVLMSVHPDTKKVKLLCIPRDTYAYLPVVGRMDKINHAYAFGSTKNHGIEASTEAIDLFLQYAKIDYYFTMDMDPVPRIVDKLGGVKINVESDMKTGGVNLSKGLQVLNGKQAFDYIHWRYSSEGDIGRIKRQQQLLKEIVNKMRNPSTLLKDIEMVMQYRSYIHTDLSLKQIIALSSLIQDIPEEGAEYDIIPGECKEINHESFWIPDEEKTYTLLKNFFDA